MKSKAAEAFTQKECRYFRIKCTRIVCGKEFLRDYLEVERKGGKFCSFGCYVATSKSPIEKQVRDMYQYRKWRDMVFKRDDYTCHGCGKRGEYMHVHHIIAFDHLLKRHNINSIFDARDCVFLWDINNGITLCVDCHTETTNYGRLKNRVSHEYLDIE